METYRVIGLMSGTSLDGLDMALCHFSKIDKQWKYEIKKAYTIPYPKTWINKLTKAHKLDALEFIKVHNEYGRYLGKTIQKHFEAHSYDFIASHGHTIFHQTNRRVTFQIGNGASIAAETGKTCISDFRTLDVALNGQGAPLVPIGDKLLFADYDYCLNLGGIANISYEKDNSRMAFDICPANMPFNYLCQKSLNIPFDKNGAIAKSGRVNTGLLKELSDLAYYSQEAPKSLGREWFEDCFLPIIENTESSLNDKLRTLTEHLCLEVKRCIDPGKSMLITGGGAHNTFLIQKMKEITKLNIEVPNSMLIDYKEALVFAFLGVLRHRNEVNCLASVTGATHDNCGGVIHRI